MDLPDDLGGVWHRLVISRPGTPVDTLTQVDWVQGPGLYVDLRQPNGLDSMVEASCLAELTLAEARVLATQEGFAGRLAVCGDVAEWHREIDLLPPGPLGDRGRLERHGELMLEYGLDADYIEYWQREMGANLGVSAAARFRDEDGRLIILVQHGARFAYGRDSGVPPEEIFTGGTLHDLQSAHRAFDCEISVGTVTAQGWRIDRSSLPWRRGAFPIGPDARLVDGSLVLSDVDRRGLPMSRRLRLIDRFGEFVWRLQPESGVRAPAPAASDPNVFSEIPVVDISPLQGGDPATIAATVEELRAAASQVGFLYVAGHGIAPAVIDRLRAAAARFFDQPLSTKLESYIGNSRNHRGYVPEGEESFDDGPADRKEAYDLALDLPADAVPAGHPLLGPNQWPDLPGFREDVMAYYAAAFDVGKRVLRGLAMALGRPPDSLDHLVVRPPSQLRLIHYPHDPEAVDVPGIGAHTDYECFTLLLATAPGLEVMNQAGEWIAAPPVPGALVVNIGDMMEFWSGGAFVATPHRVRKVAQERYSFPLFFAVDYDVRLRPLAGPRQGEELHAGEHLLAQTMQTFRYLKERAACGEISLPENALPVSSFGQHARDCLQPQGQKRNVDEIQS